MCQVRFLFFQIMVNLGHRPVQFAYHLPIRLSSPEFCKRVLPFTGRQDSHHFSVLGNRSSSDVNVILLQHFYNFLVRERFALILLLYDFSNFFFYAFRCYGIAGYAIDGAVEEKFQLEYALRGMHILVRGHPAYGRFVHVDIFCDILENQRFQVRYAVVEKTPLKLDNAFRHLVDGSLPLMDALDQPDRCSKFFL